jgi:hypothetical protein
MLAADIRFEDGITAKSELVFGGTLSDVAQTELTPIALMQTSASAREKLDGCFTFGEKSLRASAIETPNAVVFVIRDPSASDALVTLDPPQHIRDDIAHLDKSVTIRMVWPVAGRIGEGGEKTALFPMTQSTAEFGLFRIITRVEPGRPNPGSRRYADAVAVAGERATSDGTRRAVVLVLGHADRDESDYEPQTVRRYLDSIGVPLFVWSFAPAEGLAAQWKSVIDVSTPDKLSAATKRLQTFLDVQRIAWLDADPVTALRASVNEACGYAALARTP